MNQGAVNNLVASQASKREVVLDVSDSDDQDERSGGPGTYAQSCRASSRIPANKTININFSELNDDVRSKASRQTLNQTTITHGRQPSRQGNLPLSSQNLNHTVSGVAPHNYPVNDKENLKLPSIMPFSTRARPSQMPIALASPPLSHCSPNKAVMKMATPAHRKPQPFAEQPFGGRNSLLPSRNDPVRISDHGVRDLFMSPNTK